MNKIIYLVYIQNLSIFKFQKLSNLILDMSQKKKMVHSLFVWDLIGIHIIRRMR